MAHFDEKSGVIPCHTPWGQWYQTIDEVVMEINVPEGTRSKEVKANFTVNNLTCSVCDINIKVSELSGILFVMRITVRLCPTLRSNDSI